jgi:glycerol kinase
MQITADLLGKDVVRPRILETTALGAARLALAGVSRAASSASDAPALKHEAGEVDRTFASSQAADARGAARARWRRAVDTVRAFGSPS